MNNFFALLFAFAFSLSLTACASFSSDGGLNPARQLAQERLGKDLKWTRSASDRDAVEQRVKSLLDQPLSADDAVQMALLNNRSLQASFAELGIAESDWVQAGRLPNPRFAMLRARAGVDYKIEQALTFNIMSLLTMPMAKEVEQRRFAQTQLAVAQVVAQLATETRKAWTVAVAADETVRYMEQVKQAAEASAELARGMLQAGNWSRVDQAREQGFYNDAVQGLAHARLTQQLAREHLIRLLGLPGSQTLHLPQQLPDLPELPAAEDDLPNIETQAMQNRLDLQMARAETEALAKNLGLTRTTRFINVLEIGPARVLEGARSDPYKKGYEISFELPLFDWGDARVVKAEALYMQAVNRAAATAVNARSEVRAAWQTRRTRYDLARHQRDEVLPLRKQIADENLLRYNGMLISVFDLLADARAQMTAVNDSIEALRDFWMAQAEMDGVVLGGGMASMRSAE